MVAVVCGGWSHHVCGQEPEQEDCCSVHPSLYAVPHSSSQSGDPDIWVDLPTTIYLIKKLPHGHAQIFLHSGS